MKIETKFDIKDEVTIKELERKGIILSIFFDFTGIQYYVRYFDNAKAEKIYFYENELTLFKSDE